MRAEAFKAPLFVVAAVVIVAIVVIEAIVVIVAIVTIETIEAIVAIEAIEAIEVIEALVAFFMNGYLLVIVAFSLVSEVDGETFADGAVFLVQLANTHLVSLFRPS